VTPVGVEALCASTQATSFDDGLAALRRVDDLLHFAN
jgi:hypothetical protein